MESSKTIEELAKKLKTSLISEDFLDMKQKIYSLITDNPTD